MIGTLIGTLVAKTELEGSNGAIHDSTLFENNRYCQLLRSILIVTGLISTLYFFFARSIDRKTDPSRNG